MRTVLITGAAHGIGAATARLFAAEGDHVVITDIDLEAAAELADEIRAAGGSATAYRLDVGDLGAWQTIESELRAADQSPSVVVNNAFAVEVTPAHLLDEKSWNRQLNVTLSGVYRSIHTFATDLQEHHGCMVNVASVHATLGFHGHPAYAAAKGGVVALTRQLSVDYAPAVRFNAVLPGSIDTRVWDAAPASARAAAVRQATLGRLGTPEEVASVIVFLASPGASYVTGAAIPVDGGQTTTVDT